MILPITKNLLVDAWLTLTVIPLVFNGVAYGFVLLTKAFSRRVSS